MYRSGTFLLEFLLLCALGCGTSTHSSMPQTQPVSSSGTPKAADQIPMIASILPGTVTAGSPDVTLTITGAQFENKFIHQSIAFWTTDSNLHDHGTMLPTTFVSTSQITAVIPAALLESPTEVQIVVLNGDSMGMSDGFFGYPRSNTVIFTVAP